MVVSVVPTSSAKKGEIALQPAYFTSSLFVDAFRADVAQLVASVAEVWTRQAEQGSQVEQPFAKFKEVWHLQGWPWLHVHVLEARARERFLGVVMRLFLERIVPTEAPFTRVIALYALYTFYNTQPSSAAPKLHRKEDIPIPLDWHTSLLSLPSSLSEPHLERLREQAFYTLSVLLPAFRILPPSEYHAQNPRNLPREIFVQDGIPLPGVTGDDGRTVVVPVGKKKGRPSKRERAKRAKEAIDELERWLDKTAAGAQGDPAAVADTGAVLGSAPRDTRETYRSLKRDLLDALLPAEGEGDEGEPVAPSGADAVHRANMHILTRLRRLDQLAAERGLEIGSAGGERTGLGRVERAVSEWEADREKGDDGGGGRDREQRGGILSMMEGAGLPKGANEQESIVE